MGIDIRKVLETGLTPVINTGIAHRLPARPNRRRHRPRPLACFEQGARCLRRDDRVDA
jgi:hypothetical protein